MCVSPARSTCPRPFLSSRLLRADNIPTKGSAHVVELDHSFTSSKSTNETWQAILDLERLVPCVEGGTVLEKTGPESVKAEIKVKMGAMSMKFTGTVNVIEQDEANHRAVLQVKSREA